MSFEEKFPELDRLMIEWTCEEDSGFYPEDIEKYCLSKQRVIEAIDECKKWKPINCRPIEMLWKLEKELGLED